MMTFQNDDVGNLFQDFRSQSYKFHQSNIFRDDKETVGAYFIYSTGERHDEY